MRSDQKAVVTVGALLLLVMVAGIVAAQTSRTAGAVYQEGLLKKDGEGDLEGAIKLFARILADFPKERAFASLAQLQIGMCYEKLGLAKAEEAYRKVVADFGDQPEAVKAARERLSALAGARAATTGEPGLVFRQLSLPEGMISPDGKYIAHEDWDTVPGVVIYDIGSGKELKIASGSGGKACCLTVHGWTPSSQRAVFDLQFLAEQVSEIRTVGAEGQNEQLICRLENYVMMGVGGFSADEKALYVLVRSNDWTFHAIGRISIDDGKYVEIINLGHVQADNLKVSPDGQYLAYNTSPYQDYADSDIHILRVDGRDESPLVSGPATEELLGWMPDNRGIIFSSTRSGELAIWSLPVGGGKQAGDPVFVKSIKGFVTPYGFTRAGEFYFSEFAGGQDVYYAQVDFDSGKRISEPVKVEPVYSGRSLTPLWSPDGKSLSYIFLTSQESDPLCQYILKIRSLSTGKTKDILLGFKPQRYIFAVGWAADGRSIILRGDSNGKTGLWWVDVSTGESRMVHESSRIAAFSAGGQVIYESSSSSGDRAKREFWVVRKDLRTGSESEIYRGKPGEMLSWMSVSPDEKLFGFKTGILADYVNTDRYIVIPENGGPEEARFQGHSLFYWAPKSRGGVVGLKKFAESEKQELWYYPRGSNKAERLLGFGDDMWGDIVFSPDGRYVAYTADRKQESTFWAVENYLPAKK